MITMKIKAGIVGATGYAGAELVRLLSKRFHFFSEILVLMVETLMVETDRKPPLTALPRQILYNIKYLTL